MPLLRVDEAFRRTVEECGVVAATGLPKASGLVPFCVAVSLVLCSLLRWSGEGLEVAAVLLPMMFISDPRFNSTPVRWYTIAARTHDFKHVKLLLNTAQCPGLNSRGIPGMRL